MSESSERPASSSTLGSRLKTAREAAGLSISEIAQATHVRSAYLSALEEGRYVDLPEDVYSRNFVRLFAASVALPVDETLEIYQRERRAALGTTTLDQRLEQDRSIARRVTSGADIPITGRGAPLKLPRPTVLTSPYLLGSLLVVAVVALAGWGLMQLQRGNGGELLAESPTTVANGASNGASADAPAFVSIDIVSTPPGATVTLDGFVLAGVTPLTGELVSARSARTVEVELVGHEPLATTVDLLENLRLEFTLAPLEGLADADSALAEEEILFTITETSWFEAWQSTSRNTGERLAYLTAQPGAEFRLKPPIYVHVGNARGVLVQLPGQEPQTFTGQGGVSGRAFVSLGD